MIPTLLADEAGSRLLTTLEYNSDLFSAEKIAGIAGHFKNLLEEVTSYPDVDVLDIKLASEEDERGGSKITGEGKPASFVEGAFQFE